MAFQIKDFASVSASMINWMRSVQTKITDFNVGGVARTMLEAVAIEIEELYLRMFIGLREAIPVSVYNTFGFDKLPAAKASGTLRFTTAAPATSAILIQAGTSARVPGKTIAYVTAAAATIPVGGTFVDVLATADAVGALGNTGSGTITEMVGTVQGVSSVTNTAPVINGRDEETDDERLNRFRAYISSLARGTVAAVLYGARTAVLRDSQGQVSEYVALSALNEPWLTNPAQPVGLVNLYIHNGASATTPALVAETQRVVDGYYKADGTAVPGWKAAGVKVVVAAASDQSITITGTLSVNTGYVAAEVIAKAQAALRLYLQSLNVGAAVVKAELVAIIKRDVEGVTNVHLTLPADDVSVPQSSKAVPGTITLTAA